MFIESAILERKNSGVNYVKTIFLMSNKLQI